MSTMEERAAEVAEALMAVASTTVRPLMMTGTTTNSHCGDRNDNLASTGTTAFGFGIDSNTSEAAVKAVRDALDRTLCAQLHKSSSSSSSSPDQEYSISILLGVPNERKMDVDIAKLARVIPPEFSTKTTIQNGGLYVPHTSKIVVVASLSFEMLVPPQPLHQSQHQPQQQHHQQLHHQQLQDQQLQHQDSFSIAATTSAMSQQHLPELVKIAASTGLSSSPTTMMMMGSPLSPPPLATQLHGFHPHSSHQQMPLLENNSIDMLAQVSVELMSQQQLQQEQEATGSVSPSGWASAGSDTDGGMYDGDDARPGSFSSINNNGCYKKLPPGKTPKNHERLFVKHEYRDFSHEVPMVGELSLVGPSALDRTPNAPFPLKLHEILAQIEVNGDDHIIGWLAHGRSFRIHDHRLFVDLVLPKYFVMNKKSSFLRQLNLYGFHRLSRVGADQGSYYHEKFLKGMKFLCRRMARQKVNGNGIRAAGNPDQEPILSEFPSCPPLISLMKHQHHQQQQQQLPVEQQQHSDHQILMTSTITTTTSSATAQPLISQSSQDIIEDNGYNSDASLSEGGDTADSDSSTTTTTAMIVTTGNATIDTSALDNIPPSLGTMQSASFPLKLQRILDKLESEQQTATLSWLDHGRAFIVRDVARFVEDLAPVYFNLTKYSSFQRQCHMYHFQRITCGPDKGAYHHPSFLRGRPDLAMLIQRTRVNGKGVRRPGNPDKEPDFYSLPFRPPVTPLTFLGHAAAYTATTTTIGSSYCNTVVSIGEESPGEQSHEGSTATTTSVNSVVLVAGGGNGGGVSV